MENWGLFPIIIIGVIALTALVLAANLAVKEINRYCRVF